MLRSTSFFSWPEQLPLEKGTEEDDFLPTGHSGQRVLRVGELIYTPTVAGWFAASPLFHPTQGDFYSL